MNVLVMAQDKSTSVNPADRTLARQLGRSSYRVSAAGIIIGIIFITAMLTHDAAWRSYLSSSANETTAKIIVNGEFDIHIISSDR